MPEGVDGDDVSRIAEGVCLARDLINTPANDMGPVELEYAARALATKHRASVNVIVGDDLLRDNFPLIHAVGRAAAKDRPPRLIDITWGDPAHPKVTLIGKGVCFDTGGLDIKSDAGMLNMKKDMGGAATMLALGHMLMSRGIKLRLRILIPAVENSIAGSAFRPRDIYRSRKGITVEIGNTDAEGRLILADAMALAEEEKPELIADMATLTGAARVALGTEVVPFYTDDETLASDLSAHAKTENDPLWRLPLWRSYDQLLELQGRRYQQRVAGRVCGIDHRRAVPAPLRHRGQGLAALRHLCLEPGHAPGTAGRRRMPGGARALRAAGRALWLTVHRNRMPACWRRAATSPPNRLKARSSPNASSRAPCTRSRHRRRRFAASRGPTRCSIPKRSKASASWCTTAPRKAGPGASWSTTTMSAGCRATPCVLPARRRPTSSRRCGRWCSRGPDIKLTPIEALSFGCQLPIARTHQQFAVTADNGFVPLLHLGDRSYRETDFVAVAERFMGTPYVWGGKTSLGLDCSALTQLALRSVGIVWPRDTLMQEPLGARIEPAADFSDLVRGDLIFWIGHVAIVRDSATLIHANAHHMAVAIEPIAQAVARIRAGGSEISSVRRLEDVVQ